MRNYLSQLPEGRGGIRLSGTAVFATLLLSIGIHLSAIPQQSPVAAEVTFSKDVAPIVFEHCVYCHRGGNIGPFSAMTYGAVRPWARSIRQAVLTRRMPPWFADPNHGKFLHERRLSDRDIRTIVAWVDGGSQEGNPADLPSLPRFSDGWQIGNPDLVVTMSESYKIPASGVVPVVSLPTDYVFQEDTWVQAIEVRPGNRSVVHQALARLGSGGLADGLNLYSSGLGATVYREGYGKFIPKGTRVHLQMHYNTTGHPTTDRTQVGFKFAVKPVHTEVRTGIAEANATPEPVLLESHQGSTTFPLPSTNARLHAFRLHMVVRGGHAAATLVLADGSRKVLLAADGWGDGWEYDYVLSRPEPVPPRAFVEFSSSYDGPVQNLPKDTHVLYFEWTEVNQTNRDDLEPIEIPANPLFTTGLRAPLR